MLLLFIKYSSFKTNICYLILKLYHYYLLTVLLIWCLKYIFCWPGGHVIADVFCVFMCNMHVMSLYFYSLIFRSPFCIKSLAFLASSENVAIFRYLFVGISAMQSTKSVGPKKTFFCIDMTQVIQAYSQSFKVFFLIIS